ncbi:unnamed protein product [Ectocarpus fasciculatus]
MHSPSRCAPPPPSDPPPPNISRSGRVPPPRGAPPAGGARRARQAARRPLRPQALEPTGDRVSAGQHDGGQGLNRRGDFVLPSPSHEGSPSDGSSRESFEGSLSSDHERRSHPLPAVRKRQIRRSLGTNSTSPHNGREELLDSRSIPGERGSRRHRNQQQDAGPDRRSLRLESSSWSSDDDVSNAKADVHQGARGRRGSPRKEERREVWDRNEYQHSPRRELHDTALSDSSHRRHRDTQSDVGSEESEKRSDVHRKSHKRHPHQHQRANNSHRTKSREDRDRVGPDRTSSLSSGSTAEERPRSAILEDGGSRSRANDCGGSPERPQLNMGESRRGRRNRRSRRKRAEQDDSEAEGYGWSGNKYSWDSADVDSAGSSSDQPELTKLNPNGGDDGKQQPKRQSLGICTGSKNDEDSVTHTIGDDNNTAAAAPEKLFRSPDRTRGKVDHSGALESDREQDDSANQKVAGSSGSGYGPTRPSITSDAKSLPRTTVNRAEVAVGKPIRGARWGESIGVRSTVFDSSTIPTKRADLKRFVCGPLHSGPGTVLRCFIERDRSGTHKFSPVFSMYADLGDGSGRMLLAARKLLASKTAYYTICTRQEDVFKDDGKRGGNSFLAKLRASSVAHTEYALYDRGDNPAVAVSEASVDSGAEAKPKSMRNPIDLARSKALRHQERHGQGELRRELGVIIYNFDKKEQRTGKRRMEVAIPQLEQEGDSWKPVSWQPSDTKESMINNFGRIRYQGAQNFLQDDRLLIYHQRESRYDPLSSCLVDYRGRATAPSVKNFQLLKSPPEDNVKRARYFSEGAGKNDVESDDIPRPVFLQMGKVGKDCFNVDLEWPLSVLQGFAICLSRFDSQAQF